MKRKILIGALALMISALAFASGDKFVPAPKYFDGFYAGVGAGVSHTMADVKSTATDVQTWIDDDAYEVFSIDTLPTSLNSDVGKTGFNGNLFLGYGKSFITNLHEPKFYLGGELFGQYTPVKLKISADSQGVMTAIPLYPAFDAITGTYSTSIDVKNDFSFGGAIRFGYLVTPRTMIYILGGAQAAQFEVNYNHSAGSLSGVPQSFFSSPVQGINWSYTDKCWRAGFVPGVGIETMLTKNLSLRAQYIYVYYSSYSIQSTGSNTENTIFESEPIPAPETVNTTTASDTSVQLSQGSFTLGLTYHLNFLQ